MKLLEDHDQTKFKYIDIQTVDVVPTFIVEVPHFIVNNTIHLSGKRCFDWVAENPNNESNNESNNVDVKIEETKELSINEQVRLSEERAVKMRKGILN